jgi:iron complex outermembrane receptor protein
MGAVPGAPDNADQTDLKVGGHCMRRYLGSFRVMQLLALCSALPLPAVAAAAADEEALEEITVTATRRAQNLQEIGIAVTALGSETLRELAITNTNELMNATPGLRLQEGGGGPLLGLMSIRGVAQNDFAGHIEAPNALYVDEVYQPAISSSIQQFYDVDRIEVLKGPQGTLFGRNATGGLVHILTKRPTDHFEGYASVGTGSYRQFRAEGMLNVPFADGVSGRVSLLRNRADGYFRNAVGPDLNEEDTSAGRVQLSLQPNERFEALFSGSIYKIGPMHTGAAYATAGTPDADGLGVPLPPGSPTAFGYVDADGDPFTGAFDNPGNIERRQEDASAHLGYTFANGVALRSITSYSKLKSRYVEDNDLSPVPFTVFRQNADAHYFTQELRLEGGAGRARWTGGAFYLDTDGRYMQGFDIQALGTTLQADYTLATRSWSLFGQGEFDLAERWKLTAGTRYTHDHKDYDYQRSCSGLCFLFTVPGSIGAVGQVVDSHGEGDWSGRLALDFKPRAGQLYYASINRGYKAFNYNAGFSGMAPLAGARFRGETLLAYELGTKLQFWSNRARFNGAVFYYDYANYQAFDQRGLNFTLFNADARVYGADFELTLRPGAGFTLELGSALLHTRVSDVPIGASRVDREAPQSPHFTLMAAIAKDFDLGFGRLAVSTNGAYTSRNYSQLTNAPVTHIPSDFVMNARVALSDPRERYELAVSAKNLLNRKRVVYAFDITGPPLGLVENTMAPPRWITVEARARF